MTHGAGNICQRGFTDSRSEIADNVTPTGNCDARWSGLLSLKDYHYQSGNDKQQGKAPYENTY